VEEPVALQPDVDERRLHSGEDVVDDPLVDVAHDRARRAPLDVELGHIKPRRLLGSASPSGAVRRGTTSAAGWRALRLLYGHAGLPGVNRDQYSLSQLAHLTRAMDRELAVAGRGGPALGGEPRLHVDALQEADRQEGDDDRGASEAHQRQWDAGDRHDPDRDADVHQDLHHEYP